MMENAPLKMWQNDQIWPCDNIAALKIMFGGSHDNQQFVNDSLMPGSNKKLHEWMNQ